jgi:asparagine synthase (glutamine-hydrolysing)
MCGIFGIVAGQTPIDKEKVLNSLNLLAHRGPDQYNFFLDHQIFLGHRRLSILDLSENGRQPMISDDQQIIITVNGEIYNFQELRENLRAKYHFKSNSDSEIILHGYREWGLNGLLERIDGMFAFVLFDVALNKIYLVRDRVGIKPLYYSYHNNTFCWSSELKSIKDYFRDLTIDKTSYYDFYTYLYIPAPKTAYKNVYKLEPGCYLEYNISTSNYKTNRYWILPIHEKKWNIKDASERLRELMVESVHEQLISDVPIGFFLSGGIDSSVVVAEASAYLKKLNTYTIGFDNKSDESKYAKIVSDNFKTNHTVKYYDDQYIDLVKKMPSWYDEPFGDTSALPSYLVSKLAVTGSTVVLTGDGGDELFGGYSRYFIFKKIISKKKYKVKWLKNLMILISNSGIPFLAGLIYKINITKCLDPIEIYVKLMQGLLREEKKVLRTEFEIPNDYDDYWYFRKYYDERLPTLKRLQYLDFNTYLPDDILTKVDRVSMQSSLEARVPFLSKNMIEFAFSLPEEICYHQNSLKGLLKESYKNILPAEILNRDKKGFSVSHSLLFDGARQKSTLQQKLIELFQL